MNWEDARLFLAVAREGQILAAANRLGISQAKLSRRMVLLEQSIGQKLLIRRNHGTELTEAGMLLADTLERVEGHFVKAEGALSDAATRLTGTVRIGMPDGFGAAFMAPRIGRLAARHQGLKIELAPAPRRFSLSRREADIAIMVGKPESQGLIGRKLTDYSLGLYASPEYLSANPAPQNLDDLQNHQLIDYVEDLIYSPNLDYARDIWRGWKASLQITSALAQHQAVRGGAGIAILHDYIAAEDPALVRVLSEHSVKRTYWMVYHESLRDIPRIRAVLDFIIEIVEEARMSFVR